MLFSYNYSKHKWWWQQKNNVPLLRAILMAMQTHWSWSNAGGIAWCSMTRATPEASGCRHQATFCSILPQRLPGQSTKWQWKNTLTLLAILMAIAMRWYNTACITQWRRHRASLEATRCHHWASTCSYITSIRHANAIFVWYFSSSNCWRRAWGKRMTPTKGNDISKWWWEALN